MAYQKGDKVEAGIWKLKHSDLYLAEVNYTDPHSAKRVRERKTTNRIDDARDWMRSRKVDALRGEIARRKKRDVVLFKDFAKEYFKVWSQGCKASTAIREKKRIDNKLKPHFGKKALHTITQKDVETYLASRRDEGIAPATANRELCRIKNMLKKAVEWGHIDTNPAANIKQSREYVDEADYLSKSEVSALLGACPERIRPLIMTAVYTGMRFGELTRLEWGDVDFVRRFITVRDTKNHQTRHVPINQRLVEMLETHRKKQTEQVGGIVRLLFQNQWTSNAYVDVRGSFNRALEKAKITRHFKFHGLRHTAASHMVMSGVDLRTVGKILGHKTAQITLRYAHLAPDYLKGAVDRLNFGEEVGRKQESWQSPR